MAITVGTEGPKLEKVRAARRLVIAKLAKKYPYDSDVVQLSTYDGYELALITALTANNDTTFDAVFTETTIT